MNTPLKKLRYFDYSVRVALVLGCFGLGINAVAYLLDPSLSLPAGNIFCIFSALALGPVAGLTSSTISLIPRAFITGEYFDSLRFILFMTAIGYAAREWKQIPAFVLMGALWVATAPAALFILPTAPHIVAGVATMEVALTLFASTLLLHRGLWGGITNRPRHTEFKDVCSYGAASLVIIGYGTGCMLYWSWNPEAFVANALVLAIMGLVLMVGTVVGLRSVTRNIQENITQYLPRTLTQNTFSGLSSTQWRRPGPTGTTNAPFADGEQLVKRWNTVTDAQSSAPGSREGLLAVTNTGEISFVNRAFRALVKNHASNLIGKQIDDAGFDPAVARTLQDLVQETRQYGPKISELKLNQLPEALRFLEFSAVRGKDSPHASLNSGADSVVITVKDISDRRTVEAHLLKGQRLASLGATVKGLAHSLNNYLTSISGHVGFARHAVDSSAKEAALTEALASAQKAGHLIRQLLEYAESKPEALSKVNLTDLMNEKLDLISRVLGADVKLTVSVPDTPLGAMCDTHLLTQAVSNLVLNAKESLPGEGTREIHISLEPETVDPRVAGFIPGGRPGNFARLTIRDSGSGMTTDVLGRAFDPLFTTRQADGHTGLGLSMVYAIVRAHDGFMAVESQPGKGTTVSIYLPVQEWRAGASVADFPKQQQTEGASSASDPSETILVVEDDAQVREVVSQMLLTLGYSVESCSSGAEALTRFSENTFDLVLVDMMMPEMNGAELIQKIRSMSDSTRTLIMTGYGAQQDEMAELDTLVIPKPFDLDTLSDFIIQTLNKIESASKPGTPSL